MYIGLHVKYPLLLSDFNEILIFPTFSKKNPLLQNFMKIRQVGAELFHADGERRTRLTVTFTILPTLLKMVDLFDGVCITSHKI